MIDLVGEMVTAQKAMTPHHRDVLISQRISTELIDIWGWVGVDRVLIEGETYQPMAGGSIVFVAPVRTHPHGPEHANPELFLRVGDIVDLVAWDPEQPDRWVLRTGAATCLGCIGPQLLDPDPVCIWRTPLRWLQSGGSGLCPLMCDLGEIQRLLLGVRHLIAEDVEHGRQLRDLLSRPLWMPTISVPATDERRAAA
jgi:hypothetical protein